MILDTRDMTLLRLAGSCQCIPFESMGACDSLTPLRREAEQLARLGYLSLSRSRRYLTLTGQGYELLDRCGCYYSPSAKRPYAGSTALRRKLETGQTALTCLGAGIEVVDDVDALGGQPVFLPSVVLRSGGGNLMNAATCIGFAHWDDTACIVQYVGEGSPGLYLANELSHLRRLASVFDPRLATPEAMLLVGGSYAELYRLLLSRTPSPRHGKQGFVDYWAAYNRLDIPIYLLSCDDAGVEQLKVISQNGHRERIAQASFGARWTPVDDAIPEADGHVGGCPLVIAIDMDLRRIQRVCAEARRQKRSEVMVAALDAQMKGLLLPVLRQDGGARALRVGPQVLEAAFGKGFSLALPEPNPAAGPEGALIYV